jgi:hypothetical protein
MAEWSGNLGGDDQLVRGGLHHEYDWGRMTFDPPAAMAALWRVSWRASLLAASHSRTHNNAR